MTYRTEELLAVCIARLIRAVPTHHIAVGAASPIPAAACWLAVKQGEKLHLSLLHKRTGNPFTEGSRELFDLTGQGRIDLFFLGGGQIDGQANINLVGIGEHGHFDVRWPGSRGTPMLYMAIPNTILYSTDHTLRAMVERVSFISAPGTSPAGVWRPGGASALVTPRCVFGFDKQAGRFTLQSVHPGHDTEEVRAHTGFDYDTAADVGRTPAPSERMLDALEHEVCRDMDDVYPQFARRLRGELREARGVQA